MQQTLWEPRELHCTNPVFVRQSTQNKHVSYWIKQIKQTRATNFTGAEGIALHKPGVCETKHGKHKLLTTRAGNKLREPRGKALKLYVSQGKGSKQTGSRAPAKHRREKVHPHWRLVCLKHSWSLCTIGRGRTGSSAILIKQESVNWANGFLRDLGEIRCGALISTRVARDCRE